MIPLKLVEPANVWLIDDLQEVAMNKMDPIFNYLFLQQSKNIIFELVFTMVSNSMINLLLAHWTAVVLNKRSKQALAFLFDT